MTNFRQLLGDTRLKSDMKIPNKGFHQFVENGTKQSISLAV
jgi:hypothetical protein